MARSQNLAKRGLRPSFRKDQNTRGYAKRKSLKAETLTGGLSGDVYEYQADSVRRGKMKMQLERDEIRGSSGRANNSEDSAGEEGGMSGRSLHPRLIGENDDDEGIGKDEDEEIDSDVAFEESDDEKFAGFTFASDKRDRNVKKRKNSTTRDAKSVRFAEVDLNEDSDDAPSEEAEDSEEEGNPDDFIDVLDILDGRGEPESEDDAQGARRDAKEVGEDDAEPESDEEEQVINYDHSPSISENEDSSALQDLARFITNLDAGQKRKAPEGESLSLYTRDDRGQKRRLLKEQTQVGQESEFAAQPGTRKLNLDDLLAPLESSSNLQSLKKSVKVLATSSSRVATLAAPLPQRTQERLDREAAYEQTKEEIEKWSATMKRIKEAEHLSFPLQAEPLGKASNLELAAKFRPTTALESAVDTLLKSAKMREQDLNQTESLKMNHLSAEEVAERRAELAKMRDLMFRAEAKAKRVAKIKSKTFRRIRKKAKAKLEAQLGKSEATDDDEEEEEEGRLKREVERARERATLRHKNTGKWARAMKARGELDVDQRKEINEMLDRGEKLRRRIQGRGSDDESDSDESDQDMDEGAIRASAFNELRQLSAAEDDDVTQGKKGRSVFEMKFMKDAMAREQQRVDQVINDFAREIGDAHGEKDVDTNEDSKTTQSQDFASQRVGGRMSFRPGNMSSQLRVIPSLASDTSSVTLKSSDLLPDGASPSSATTSPTVSRVPLPELNINPWLAPLDGTSQGAIQKKHEVAMSKTSGDADKSKNKLRKRVKKREEEKEKAKTDAAVDIEMSNVMTLGKNTSSSPAGVAAGPSNIKRKTAQTATTVGEDDASDVHSEAEAQENAMASNGKGKRKGKDIQAFQQRELVARAFAGDNVVRDFAEEKRREIDADAPKEVDMTLAGWGSWGGAGTRKAPPKPYLIKNVAGVDPQSRADYKKAHVIISERRDKKAAKYQVKDLPYPYTSKAQFERSMDTPLGTEWNTRVGFQRGTLPKVVKKMGTVITPLEKLS